MTTTAASSAPPQEPRSGRDRLAQAWAQAVRHTSYVAMNWAELVGYLRGMTDRLVEILTAEPFRADRGYALGGALVDAHFTSPRTLARTLAVLDSRVLSDLEPDLGGRFDQPEQRERVARLLGEIAAGYTQSLVDRTRDEQEGIRRAAIVAQAEAERALRASDARFRAVFAATATGIGIANLDGEVIEANAALATMLGYTVRELRHRAIKDFIHSSDRSELCDWYGELVTGKRDQFRVEKRFHRKDGSELWADLSVSLVREERDKPRYVVAMMHDITERQRLHQRLRGQALHDPLTQLPNRMLFLDRLHQVFDAARPADRIGLCYLDLDGFKTINDSLGHDIGDELLLRLANRLHERLTPAGHLVARMGGDEFGILVDGCRDAAHATAVADSIMEVVREPVDIGDHRLRVTASIGVVERELAGTDPAGLMKAADITLYWAKLGGKDRWAVFDAERNAREVTRHTLAATMPAALSGDEFVIEYQPIVELASGRPLGAEALLRWEHPRYGRLAPDRFLPLAEETGLIDLLGRWVLRRACRQAAAWGRAHPRLAPLVSVNVSARQLADRRLVDDLRDTLDSTGLAAPRLQLELTENTGARLTDPDVVENLRTLASCGVRLTLDDFGTGPSHLDSLRRVPVDGLKIAGSFVAGLHPARNPAPVTVDIVRTVVGLAGRLGIQMTAQHIETEAQVALLKEMGCPIGQGHLLGRPGPAAEFGRMLDQLTPRS